ncbi:centromere protein M [Protobothrops mucrosquamatus]|uniref:centromere protein M n=1 Tax=Protobothrops mucrosquamatus TaxID=103944 RepID=UPI0007757101|nr:centromere protein M [Protobothrops mucrosquamatus]
MSTLSAFGKLPTLNSATILLVGTNDVFQQQLAETLLKERQDLKINIHLAASLPLPVERNHVRPRIDLIVFMINIQSKYSFEEIEASLIHVDANFFLGKVCLLVTGVGRMNKISVDMDAIWKLANRYCSPVLLCELEYEKIRTATAQRLLRMLQICAGHVSGMSSLSFSSLMKCSIEDSSYLA